MSVTAAAGIFGFGAQAGMGQVPASWFRHRAVNVDLGVVDDVREGQMEVGGVAVPTFPYKGGVMVAGGATLQPRLEDSLGWLLYGAMGKCTSTEAPALSGIYDHVFEMADDSTLVPWVGFRKVVPKRNGEAGTGLGEQYNDCKIIAMGLQLPSAEPISMRIDALGRLFEEELDPDTNFVWDNTFENWESIPVGCVTNGYLKIDGEELPVVAAQVAWQNAPLDIRQERVFGSPYLDDVTIVQRRLSYDITVKWNNPELYLKCLTGQAAGVNWTPVPKTAAFDVMTLSSVNMDGETEPFSLRIEADEVMMTHVGGIVMAAGQSVLMRFQGTALESANYARMTLRNKKTGYIWPVGSGS